MPTHRRAYVASRYCLITILTILWVILAPSPAVSQGGGAAPPAPATPFSTAANVEPSGQSATVTFSNREIAVLRARVVGRTPAERAAVAVRLLDELVAERIAGPVTVRVIEGSNVISVGSRSVLVLTPIDLDDPTGATLDAETARIVGVLNLALTEAIEARTPRVMLQGVLLSALALALATVLLILIARAHLRISRRLIAAAEAQVVRMGLGRLETLRTSRVLDFWRSFLSLVSITLGLFVIYSALTFSLRRFPYTRPWGESMREFMLGTISRLALDMVHAVPALFTVVVIFLIARFFIRLLQLFFKGVEQGQVNVRWLHQETAQPTRRLVTALLWLFAAVMAYPYLPGSGTDAFKGASVFIGLVLSLGSSGLVNQVMSSFMITYSRALRLGDFVRIGETEGIVTHVGVLSTKIKTPRAEEVTIPNALVVATTTTNYSRFAESDGIYTPTSVTIGYDTPWRQVQSLLLLAAERTATVRKQPAPFVLQSELQDFYVKYTLLVCPERPERRALVLNTLHANILDVFNEHGVQIMSPNYEADPGAPKIVPRDQWFAAPAPQDGDGSR